MAPMCPLVRGVTAVLWCLPLGLGLVGLAGASRSALCGTALMLPLCYAGVWLWCRPAEFCVGQRGVEIRWPLRSRTLPWTELAAAQAAPAGAGLREQLGVAIRVGVGGLWGAFGWIWSTRRGWCTVYVSRTQDLVWLERLGRPPLLLSPERPLEFVEAVRARSPRA